MTYVAIKRHAPESGDVLRVAAGDTVQFERRNTVYTGWILCTDAKGVQAWVPEAYVFIKGAACRMIRDYDSRELTGEVNERVEVLEIESGWAWVRTSEDELG